MVLLDQHKIVADGTHAELLASTPLYAEVLAQAAEYEAAAERDEDEDDDHTGTGPAADAAAFGALLDAARSGGAR